MKRTWIRVRAGVVVFAVLAATALMGAGCARKAVEQPPAPTPTPQPQTQTPAPAEPTPTPSTPEQAEVTSDDFQPAFFDYDSAVLRDDARQALDHDARLLRDNPDLRVTVEGHCDERGTVEYNQALGERRAQAAFEYMTAAGISADRMQIISYGKERPFDSGHDERAWALNRRAHFVLR